MNLNKSSNHKNEHTHKNERNQKFNRKKKQIFVKWLLLKTEIILVFRRPYIFADR